MLELMIGNNWDINLLHEVIRLNEQYKSNKIRVTEMFGSLLDNPIGTARPDYRVQDKCTHDFEAFVLKATENSIEINYTINIPCFGSLHDLKGKESAFINFLEYLEASGVTRVTCTHPLIIDIVNKHTDLKVELSTIYEIDSLSALTYFIGKVDKICMKLAKNRDFEFLYAFNKLAQENGIVVELLANEFCIIYCVDRAQCYQLHGHTKEKNKLFGFYPMGKCINKRYQEPVEWIKAPFILPQWMSFYRHWTGINNFKITGRTHPTSYIVWVTEQYMKRTFKGNLLELWAHLENIGKDESDYSAPRYKMNIADLSGLLSTDFLAYLARNKIDCSVDCETKCKLCYDIVNMFNLES